VLCSPSGQPVWLPPVWLAVRAPGCRPELGARLRSCAHKSATAQLSLSALCEAAEEAVVVSAAPSDWPWEPWPRPQGAPSPPHCNRNEKMRGISGRGLNSASPPLLETLAPLRRGFSCVVCRAETRTLREWYYSPMWVTVCFRAAGSQMRVTSRAFLPCAVQPAVWYCLGGFAVTRISASPQGT
jgi:hypothetical protein